MMNRREFMLSTALTAVTAPTAVNVATSPLAPVSDVSPDLEKHLLEFSERYFLEEFVSANATDVRKLLEMPDSDDEGI